MSLQNVVLIRPTSSPGTTGPYAGQYALQKALLKHAPGWFRVGTEVREDELPWFWSWKDRPDALQLANAGRRMVLGPNIFFIDNDRPRKDQLESDLLDSPATALHFTESQWYADLMHKHLPENHAPIEIWPYPVFPIPPGPAKPIYDVMIYAKTGVEEKVVNFLTMYFPRSVVVRYGGYKREEMHDLARRSRCCVYLSASDRGPIALAEILHCGCPGVGIPCGAPWVQDGKMGVGVESLTDRMALVEAVQQCHELSREEVRLAALGRFDGDRTAAAIFSSLDGVRGLA